MNNVNPADAPQKLIETALYAEDARIYPRAVTGWFAAWRWTLVWATQLVFYGGAWLQWNGRQAVLLDIAHRKFYIFGLVFWPQDVIYLTALLIVSALSLFLFTAVAGRLWCGYACPQTVYTEIFMWIERMVEGDRAKRMRLDAEPWGARKFGLKATKHALWVSVGLWTGFTFVGYFTPIRDLLGEIATFQLSPWGWFWLLFYSFATYGNAGWMREQVCKYMCPYARFQSAMFDKDTMIITYDRERGEPRGSRAKNVDPKSKGLGSCVDCGICVQVCPTGIDIRKGLQYECIGCAACIDGCNTVMDRMGYPRGLIRYSTTHAVDNKLSRAEMFRRAFRPRILVYTSVLGAVVIAAASSILLRVPLKVDVIRDRAAISREVEGGQIENIYRLQVMNTQERAQWFDVRVEGIPGAVVAGIPGVQLDGASSLMVPLRVRIPGGAAPKGNHNITFIVTSAEDPKLSVRERAIFVVR